MTCGDHDDTYGKTVKGLPKQVDTPNQVEVLQLLPELECQHNIVELLA
jgi:hypothetical protein